MKRIVIFAGTTEGRTLSEYLAAAGITHTLCVATEYGEIVLKEHPLVKVHCGRMDKDQIREFLSKEKAEIVVDATHPYAVLVTENIKAALNPAEMTYLRLARRLEEPEEALSEKLLFFEEDRDCAEWLEHTEGNILLTTGSKKLGEYCRTEKLKSRLYVRVLPGLESLQLCMENGIAGKQILALQGPFTEELNEAILRQFAIRFLVTKRSGKTGGYGEKLEAARKLGIPVLVIDNPGQKEKEDKTYSFAEVCQKLEEITGCRLMPETGLEIVLAGIGMGDAHNRTREVEEAIREADILLGADRMIAPFSPRLEKKSLYTADKIIPYLENLQQTGVSLKVVVLFSGDSGFYSGCQKVYQALEKAVEDGSLKAAVRVLPGISSVSYLAAALGESYQDAAICSMHGRQLPNLTERIRCEKKTFLLLSGAADLNRLGELLQETGLEQCRVYAGQFLSYPNQKISVLTPAQCEECREEGLYTCLVVNPFPQSAVLTPSKKDSDFIRERTPMTKEEIRQISICKLKLHRGAVAYDIGSGTGSVSVEMAALSGDIKVFAIEKKEEAFALTKQNRQKFHLENLTVLQAEAPEGLEQLPAATHAFIGGSGGNLRAILKALYHKNPHMRVVMNAISLETLSLFRELLTELPVQEEEVIQLQVARSSKVGEYHLMQSENPVWICSFRFFQRPDEDVDSCLILSNSVDVEK